MITCGVDVGAGHAYPAVLDLAARTFVFPGNQALAASDAVKWVLERQPVGIAIDSPPRPHLGLLRDNAYRQRNRIDLGGARPDKRVTEWRLGIGGCYSTRSRVEDCPPWMRTGMALFASLERGGYELDLGGGGTLFEIHPTYGFRSLLGMARDGLRIRTDPKRVLRPKLPVGSVGQRQRLAVLQLLCDRWQVPLDVRATRSIDWLDAMLGAALVVLRHEGGTVAVGAPDADEGAIVIAAAPLDGAEEAVALVPAPADRAHVSAVGHRLRNAGTEGSGMLLRLGSQGLGVLSQQATLDVLQDCEDASEIILPVGSRVGRAWQDVAATDGLTVLLSFGEHVRARLKVTRIVSNGPETPFGATGVKQNPWPMETAPSWFVADAIEFLDATDRDFLFRHGGEWRRGFTLSQSSWIGYRDA
jgi:hypothetical protein